MVEHQAAVIFDDHVSCFSLERKPSDSIIFDVKKQSKNSNCTSFDVKEHESIQNENKKRNLAINYPWMYDNLHHKKIGNIQFKVLFLQQKSWRHQLCKNIKRNRNPFLTSNMWVLKENTTESFARSSINWGWKRCKLLEKKWYSIFKSDVHHFEN